VPRPGRSREALHARRDHCRRETGRAGIARRYPARRLARAALSREGRRGRGRRCQEALVARGGRLLSWTQLKTFLWLRWRLSRNQGKRLSRVNVTIDRLLKVLLVVFACGSLV